MTIDEAIEILTEYRKRFHPNTDFDYAQAVSQSIEALKVIMRLRELECIDSNILLPGETKEV